MKPPYLKPAARLRVLEVHRAYKMASSTQAFVRGGTAKFYEWLAEQPNSGIPHGPTVWICGDCHTGNLGPVADAKGRVENQIRDFDQTVIGNPAYDLIRLGLSLCTTARSSDLSGVTSAKMLEQMLIGYSIAFGRQPYKGQQLPEVARLVMKKAIHRSWKKMAKDQIQDAKPTISLGKNFWVLARNERAAVERLFEQKDIQKLVTMLRSRPDNARIEVLDAAFWMKGCSSLGLLRIAVLLQVGKNIKKDLCLIDLKQAISPLAPVELRSGMPRNSAARVVAGARHLSPFLGERMLGSKLIGRDIFLRELMPQDLKLNIENLSSEDAMKTARFLAGVVGMAHARQMDEGTRKNWIKELNSTTTKTLDAPSWLWSNVVNLIAYHEKGYLEHCRVYAQQ